MLMQAISCVFLRQEIRHSLCHCPTACLEHTSAAHGIVKLIWSLSLHLADSVRGFVIAASGVLECLPV